MATRRLLTPFRIILRIILLMSAILVLGFTLTGSYFITQKGLNSEWRGRISQELESLGIIADFQSLKLDPAKGLIAEGVLIYSDDSRESIIAALEHLVLDVDKTKLMRGIVRVNNVSLKKTNISLPLDLTDQNSKLLVVNDLSGEIFFPNRKTINAKNLLANLAGINLDIDANIWSSYLNPSNEKLTITEKKSRILQLTETLAEIQKWTWPADSPPLLKIYIEGDISQTDSLFLNFSLQAHQLNKNDISIKEVKLTGDYKNRLINLDSFSIKDSTGELTGSANYQPTRKQGHFRINSDLQIQNLTKKLFNLDILKDLTFSNSPRIQSKGQVHFDEERNLHFQLTGTASSDHFSFLNSPFTSLSTEFSAKGNDLFLNDLSLTQSEGELKGRILMAHDEIRYEIDSTLPTSSYLPFMKGTNIEPVFREASFTPKSSAHIVAEGVMNRHDLTNWSSVGKAEFKHILYQGAAMNTLRGNYSLHQNRSTFTGINANFDYSDYQLRKDHGGPTSGNITVKSISLDHQKSTTTVADAVGNAWPAPITRLFAPKTADYIENLRFHSPPALSAHGVFGTKNSKDTNFTVRISSANIMNYQFLDSDLSLSNLYSKIQILGDTINVNDLSFQTFHGPCTGDIVIKPPKFSGHLEGDNIQFSDLCSAYDLNNQDDGTLTGKIRFQGEHKKIETLNSTGSLTLTNGNIFSIPVLAPLTKLRTVVLGARNPQEVAADTSFSFTVKNGIFLSSDILSTTPSLRFAGEVSINLAQMTTKSLMRMNAREVLDITPNPEKPLTGLFQFEGTGSLLNPKWESTRLTNPPKGKNSPLFKSR